jgi:hypothetical protein
MPRLSAGALIANIAPNTELVLGNVVEIQGEADAVVCEKSHTCVTKVT